MKKLWIIGIWITAIFFSATAEKSYTTIDILKPGAITFAPDVATLLLVNNSTLQPETFGHTVLIDGHEQIVQQSSDSIALFCLAGTMEAFQETGFFAEVLWEPKSQNTTGNFFTLNYLTDANVDSLCTHYQADAILALNRIALQDAVISIYDGNISYLSGLDANTLASWSIHYPDKGRAEVIHYTDSLFWESSAGSMQKSINQLPLRTAAAIDMAITAGRNTAYRMLPRWEQRDRYFYTSNDKLLQQGMDSVRHRNWEGALYTWQQAADTKKDLVRAYAAANSAAVYEITGNLEKAVQQATQALSIARNSGSFRLMGEFTDELQAYLNELHQRQADETLLEKQLENP